MKLLIKIAIVSLGLCFLSGCFYERPFGYPAQIRQQGDTPCFAIENNRETRRAPLAVASVEVYRYDSDRAPHEGVAQEIWIHRYFNVDGHPVVTPYFITPGQCILYNDDGNAPALEIGKKYKVNIGTYIEQMGSGEPRLYYGYFCLSNDKSGNTIVHKVEWDDRKEGFNWDICQ